MVSSLSSFEDGKDPEGITLESSTRDGAMKDHGVESVPNFVNGLENARSNSPESSIGTRDPQAVIKWRNEVAELASSGNMARDQEAELFYLQTPSVAGSDGALSDMTSKPSRAELEEALAHPDAPLIQGYQPRMALAQCDRIVKSTRIDEMAYAKYSSMIPSSMSRNEVFFDEWDRAEAVTFAYCQKAEVVAHRRRLKIYRAVEKHIVDGGRYAMKIKREASEAFRLCKRLENDYRTMESDIYKFSEWCGHEPAENLHDAIVLLRKTEMEEGITYRKYERCQSPEPESPESVAALELDCDYHEFAADHVDKTVNPTSDLF
ncbi:hypothetical protein FBEOM_5594 [Fusarium beomiforme]|uniref:Uncharacterized protein n=1 Tax=Fusarium beomiforme TaxID=44412 RepID=A0A9P5DWZ0_9HYPO|nr:hypothetical protein FBEOM_5594 [Fusarium beomiforme]